MMKKTKKYSKPINSISKKISIILPTYNEVDNIILMIRSVSKELKNKNFEIIVVDDNSPDGTPDVVKKEMKNNSNLRLMIRKNNRGLVPSIKDGINAAKGEICIWMDADLSMSPALLNKFINHIESGADLVVGSRYIKGGGMKGADQNGDKSSFFKILRNINNSEDSILSAVLSKFGNILIKLILNVPIHDYSSGFFGGRKEIFGKIGIEGNIIDYCIRLPYKAVIRDYKVVEVPMILNTRKNGKSKTSSSLLSIFKIGFQCIFTALYLRFFTK